MHTTYNRRNLIGDGCAEPADAGLSDFGRAAIAEMNRQGVIVDVAHSGWRTSLEAARASARPMVASHTSCDALEHHIRAKPVDVIQAICETGGYVGICCIPRYLGGHGDIEALLAHIDYVVGRFGAEHVAIGTDVAYTSRQSAAESRKVSTRGRSRRAGYEKLWPEAPAFPRSPRQKSIDWVNWPMFTVGMVQRGYSDDAIRQILGGNVMRVCRANA
jgi:membrane dipeptidase